MRRRLLRCLYLWTAAVAPAAMVAQPGANAAQQPAALQIVYLGREEPSTARASLTDPVVPNYGLMGARFAINELNANGRFLGRSYDLKTVVAAPRADITSSVHEILTHGPAFIVADLQASDLEALADVARGSATVILDARSSDDSLRQQHCSAKVFHVLPNWAMRADALASFLQQKGWKRWLLLTGTAADDAAYAAAVRRAAQRSAAHIVAERSFRPVPDGTGAATPEQLQGELVRATASPVSYDLVIVLDTHDAFGERVLFNTAAPLLVAGTHGLRAVAWDPLFSDFAARGVQYRFSQLAGRPMTERDYGNWLALMIIGEAVTRGHAVDAKAAATYLLSRDFSIAAFKGEGLTFRPWDQQLRQPLLLFGPRQLVAMAPRRSSDDPRTADDTLGFARGESQCRLAGGAP